MHKRTYMHTSKCIRECKTLVTRVRWTLPDLCIQVHNVPQQGLCACVWVTWGHSTVPVIVRQLASRSSLSTLGESLSFVAYKRLIKTAKTVATLTKLHRHTIAPHDPRPWKQITFSSFPIACVCVPTHLCICVGVCVLCVLCVTERERPAHFAGYKPNIHSPGVDCRRATTQGREAFDRCLEFISLGTRCLWRPQ